MTAVDRGRRWLAAHFIRCRDNLDKRQICYVSKQPCPFWPGKARSAPVRSFVPQSLHRIDSRRAPCRQITGDGGGCDQRRTGRDNHGGVAGGEIEQERVDE